MGLGQQRREYDYVQGRLMGISLRKHELPGGETVHLDTREMREALGDEIPLNSFEVLEWARESLLEQYGL